MPKVARLKITPVRESVAIRLLSTPPFLVTRAVALVPECRTIGDIKAILGTRRSPRSPLASAGGSCRPPLPQVQELNRSRLHRADRHRDVASARRPPYFDGVSS